MKINYKIENENFKVTFCPDKQKLSIKNKKIRTCKFQRT